MKKKPEFVEKYFEEVSQIVQKLDLEKINLLAENIHQIREKNGRIFFLGVGGSAANRLVMQ